MDSEDHAARRAAARRVRQAARVLGLRTRQYVADASRAARLHDADVHAVGVLRAAEQEGREVTAGDLARELALSPAAASALIDRMERAGHVVRGRSAADGRRVSLAATESAHAMSRALFDELVDAYDDVLAGYSTSDVLRTAEIIERLAAGTPARAQHDRHHDRSG